MTSRSDYPKFGRLEWTNKGPSDKPCAVCGEPGWKRYSIQVSWFRGEDEIVLLCKSKECLSKLKADPSRYWG